MAKRAIQPDNEMMTNLLELHRQLAALTSSNVHYDLYGMADALAGGAREGMQEIGRE